MLSQFRPAFVSLLLLTLITGVIYPLVVTGIAQVAFRHGANGSVIEREKLDMVLKEQGLSTSGALDQQTAAQVGWAW